MNELFHSEHFTLHALAEGVFAAIATEDGAGASNAGLIDLGGQTLAFDAFENPAAAEDLLRASLALTGRPPGLVVISHSHPDHWRGLQVFAGSAILATEMTRQAMVGLAEEMLAEQGNPSRMQADLRATERRLEAESDPLQRRYLQGAIARQRHGLDALPGLIPTLPNLVFEGRVFFHGTRRQVELIDMGPGHTPSDCALRLAADGAAFIGDLGFFQAQPFMAYCSPPDWLARLEALAGWQIETFVPGHGPLGGKADLALEADYIRALEALVRRAAQAGGGVEAALSQALPPPFDAWQKYGRRFEANVRAGFNRLGGG
jgi:glyoxylase-like metal-dependent hydrolase (beta-lactamase superfamily II)